MIAHCANKSAPGRRRFSKWKKIIPRRQGDRMIAAMRRREFIALLGGAVGAIS
jgi:hypothetical protein